MSELDRSVNVSDWLSQTEGKLSVDVVETRKEIIVRSTIAGARAEHLELALTDDMLTIRGERSHECTENAGQNIHVQECHWGAFSRSIILPCAVDPRSAKATLKRGVLTICMKKIESDKKISILELDDI